MTDERDPLRTEKDRHPEEGGRFGWPPGYDVIKYLDDDGRPMSYEEWRRYIEESPVEVIGSETYEDPYRLPGTEPHQ